ncbi:MAG: beta-galactosidase trimerization domain-containing protein [Candidatus Omnitrophica bacterium]|nr:beta-galactosidase trimerization domain-containing protein [Candidatus Omnitrophota bacterium]
MRKIFVLLAVSTISCFSQTPSLFKQEIFPITNPGFEQMSAGWNIRVTEKGQVVPDIVYSFESIAAEGKYSLAITLNKRTGTYIPRAFQVEKGKKYYLCAKIKTVGEITAAIRVVYGAVGEPYSNRIGYDSDWSTAGVTFVGGKHIYGYGEPKNPDPKISYCELRLEANGLGTAYFDDIRIYEMKEYGEYIRFNLVKPEGKQYKVKIHGVCGAPKWYFTVYPAKNVFSSGTPGQWIDLGQFDEFKGRGTVYAGIYFEPVSEKFNEIEAIIDFAYMPDESCIIKTFQRKTPGNIIGLILPKTENNPDSFLSGFHLLDDDIKKRNEFVKSLNLPPVNLKKFYIEAHLKGFGSVFSDPVMVETEIDTIKTMGFNALDTQYSGLAGVYRQIAEKYNIKQTHHTFRLSNLPKDPQTKKVICDWQKIKDTCSSFIENTLENLRKQDPEQIPLIKFIDTGDEIAGEVFGGFEYENGYREYLKSQGLKEQDLKIKNWNELKIYGFWSWRDSWKMRPTDRTAVDSCINYYWTLRYWNWCTAKTYRILAEEIIKRMPDVSIRVNFGPPWAYGYCSYMRGAEIWEFARQNSVTDFWNEDWLNTSGWRNAGIQMVSYLVDLSRSCAKINNAQLSAFVMPVGGEANIQLKLASVIGKGAKKIDIYRYGPAYYSPDNWSGSTDMTSGVAKFTRKLEKAENILFPGKPRNPEVAIIWSASEPVWATDDASMWNQQLIYLALQHKQIPVDIVDEFLVEKGALKNYKVAILSSQYLRKSSKKAIAEWVANGGNLFVDGIPATGDEYGQNCELLLPVIGINDITIVDSAIGRSLNPQNGVSDAIKTGVIKMKNSQDSIYGVGRKIQFKIRNPEKTKIIGEWEDGSPAIIEHRYGKGKVYYAGTYTGHSYNVPVIRIPGKIETGYRESERKIITDFILGCGINRPVWCNVDCIQADLLESDSGCGIVLSNYSGSPQNQVEINIDAKKTISSVESVQYGQLKFTQDTKTKIVKINLPVDVFDFILLK